MPKTRKERLQDLLNLLSESLKRDEEMSKEIRSICSKKDLEENSDPVKVNQNVSLDQLVDALKDCMVDTVVAMDRVMEAGKLGINATSTIVGKN